MAKHEGIKVVAHSVCESDCLEGGLDVSVDVTIDGEDVSGEVTLTPDTINGGWTSYGDCVDTWVESSLLDALLIRTRHDRPRVGDHRARTDADRAALRRTPSVTLAGVLGEIRAEAVRLAEREGR